MNAKTYLNQLRHYDAVIDRRYAELAELKAKRLMLQSFDYSKDRVKTSANFEGGFENSIAKIVDMEKKLDAMTNELIDLREKIARQINALDAVYADVLYGRYILYMSFDAIAKNLHYSYSHTCHLHGWALKEFEKRYL